MEASNGNRGKGTMVNNSRKRKILVLHGDRQTGELLLGRMKSLQRKLLKTRVYDSSSATMNNSVDHSIEMVAIDGPFVWEADPSLHQTSGLETDEDFQKENNLMRTWWRRNGNECIGLEDVLTLLQQTWDEEDFEGIFGFSRGARLTHLIALLHAASGGKAFSNLKYVIMASGYGDVPLPSNFPPKGGIWDDILSDESQQINAILNAPLSIPSLHIMGKKDKLITVESSRALLSSYENPVVHEHDGGHHVPMRAADTRSILTFIDFLPDLQKNEIVKENLEQSSFNNDLKTPIQPDEEHAQYQIDECESLAMIFPDEFKGTIYEDHRENYTHPITYSIQLKPNAEELEDNPESAQLWPKKDVELKIEYTPQYPDVMPIFSLDHEMNLLEFKLSQTQACMDVVKSTAQAELGMPCVMSCVYALREFFESGGFLEASTATVNPTNDESNKNNEEQVENMLETIDESESNPIQLEQCSKEKIERCKLEGAKIANMIIGRDSLSNDDGDISNGNEDSDEGRNGKGGSWKYTIGLVGKPSAGKSTFFNAGSAFARQRGGDGNAIGGASMASHPFTTIDPNVGFCLVPAPDGSCPEDDKEKVKAFGLHIGCTHGRDPIGRRLLPVMLKDVAGLVPGAYEGRGKGNKFLDDLTDSDALIHVVDASGTADSEGNKVDIEDVKSDGSGSHPIDDLAWVHNELIQWVYLNLESKWDNIKRRGRKKLVDMFSGYKQSQAFVWDVLLAVEKFLQQQEGRDHALDHLDEWDQGDLYRLVVAFLGARFPMALALNKSDLPSAKEFCKQIKESLPLHGAHAGVPMSAHQEMSFVRRHMYTALARGSLESKKTSIEQVPNGVWRCLQSALELRAPVLVFPVVDMTTYQSLPGMNTLATRDASLPNPGMNACLEAANGEIPTLYDKEKKIYVYAEDDNIHALRDVLTLKPGSTVESVFNVLKYIGVLGGEFVRAEAASSIGEKPKLVKKDDLIGPTNRIIKIMTTKRREWQKSI